MNPTDERFVNAALTEDGLPITAGYAPLNGQPLLSNQDGSPIPVWGAIGKLPRWAKVAFAARCAHRLLTLSRNADSIPNLWDEPVVDDPHSFAQRDQARIRAVIVSEEIASAGTVNSEAVDRALLASRELRREDVAYTAVYAAYLAAHPVAHAAEITHRAIEAAMTTSRLLANAMMYLDFQANSIPVSAAPARDLRVLLRLAKDQRWTDETPVPPEVFGPMWDGEMPTWWRDDALTDLQSANP